MKPSADEPPVACSLSAAELASQRGELLPGLIERAESVTDVERGVRLRYSPEAGLLERIARVIERERACCPFLRFCVIAEAPGDGDGSIVVEVTGPEGVREMLRGI